MEYDDKSRGKYAENTAPSRIGVNFTELPGTETINCFPDIIYFLSD